MIYWATIRGWARRREWMKVLGTETVPILSPVPQRADLPNYPNYLVYMVDVAALSTEQRERLVTFLAKKFGVPEAELQRDIETRGVPILAEECTITGY